MKQLIWRDIFCFCAHNIESSEFSTMWLRLQCHFPTKYIYAVFCSPNSSDYVKFFYYLTSKVQYFLYHFSYAEISILGDIIVHLQLWLSSSFLFLTFNLVNKPSTLLSFTTQSSWCSSLIVSLTVLETSPAFLIFF